MSNTTTFHYLQGIRQSHIIIPLRIHKVVLLPQSYASLFHQCGCILRSDLINIQKHLIRPRHEFKGKGCFSMPDGNQSLQILDVF